MGTLKENLTEIKRQKDTYLLPENLKQGVTCLGITGTLTPGSETSGGVKLFATVDEMNADPNPQKGDLALCYDNVIRPIPSSYTDEAIFPENVTTKSVITEDISISSEGYGMTDYVSIYGTLSSTGLELNIESNYFYGTITYVSTDGLNYTRTDTSSDYTEYVYFGNVSLEIPTDISEFFCKVNNTFTGMYSYTHNVLDTNRVYAVPVTNMYTPAKYDDIEYEIVDITTMKEILGLYLYNIYNYCLLFKKQDKFYIGYVNVNDGGNKYQIELVNSTLENHCEDIGKRLSSSSTVNSMIIEYYELDLENKVIKSEKLSQECTIAHTYNGNNYWVANMSDIKILGSFVVYSSQPNNLVTSSLSVYCYTSTSNSTVYDMSSYNGVRENKYIYSTTQLSTLKPSSLATNVLAYGCNGLVRSDGSVYDTLPFKTRMENIFGLKPKVYNYAYDEMMGTSSSITVYTDNNWLSSYNDNLKMAYVKRCADDETPDVMLVKSPKIGRMAYSNGVDYPTNRWYFDNGTKYVVETFVSTGNYNMDIYDTQTDTLLYSVNTPGTIHALYGNLLFSISGTSGETSAQIDIIDCKTGTKINTKIVSKSASHGQSIYLSYVTENRILICYTYNSQLHMIIYNTETNTFVGEYTSLSNILYIGSIAKTNSGIYILAWSYSIYQLLKYENDTITSIYSGTNPNSSSLWGSILQCSYCLEDDTYIYFPDYIVGKTSDYLSTIKNKYYAYYDTDTDKYYGMADNLTTYNSVRGWSGCSLYECNAEVVEGVIVETNKVVMPTLKPNVEGAYEWEYYLICNYPLGNCQINSDCNPILSIQHIGSDYIVTCCDNSIIRYMGYKYSNSFDYDYSMLNGCSDKSYVNLLLGSREPYKNSISDTEYTTAVDTVDNILGEGV